MAHVKVNVKVDEDAIAGKLNTILHDDSVMLEIHNLLRKMCDPYVPFLNGPLSQTAEVEPKCVRYIQPYARYQYYGVGFNHTLDYHPQATALWNEVMMAEKGDEFKEGVKQIIQRKIKELYG